VENIWQGKNQQHLGLHTRRSDSSHNHTTSSTVQLTVLRSNISSSFLLLVKELSVISPILLLKLLLPQETRPKTKKPKQNKAKQKKFIKIINSQGAACTRF
jgi:nucleoside permease NupC